jgi:prepilin peptidase dependent protein B
MTRHQQRGLSLIEMMVGITVGMIVVAGASLLMVNQVEDHRRLVLETQVQQDLRAAADLILRDLRRAGFRERPEEGVWAAGAADPIPNAYADAASAAANGSEIEYGYSRHDDREARSNFRTPTNPEDNVVTSDERFGYRISNDVLQFKLGGSRWQPLTDPNTLTVTEFDVRINAQLIDLSEFCSPPCAAAGCQTQHVKDVRLVLSGQAKHDASVVRRVEVNTRLRNDQIVGSCSP